ncbi:MAG: alkaline phosphatase family protein [Candidatus Binataceae bacterium]
MPLSRTAGFLLSKAIRGSPLPIRTDPPPGAQYAEPFLTTGVRVPALVISPLVEKGGVFTDPFDHPCILKLIGQRLIKALVTHRWWTAAVKPIKSHQRYHCRLGHV